MCFNWLTDWLADANYPAYYFRYCAALQDLSIYILYDRQTKRKTASKITAYDDDDALSAVMVLMVINGTFSCCARSLSRRETTHVADNRLQTDDIILLLSARNNSEQLGQLCVWDTVIDCCIARRLYTLQSTLRVTVIDYSIYTMKLLVEHASSTRQAIVELAWWLIELSNMFDIGSIHPAGLTS